MRLGGSRRLQVDPPTHHVDLVWREPARDPGRAPVPSRSMSQRASAVLSIARQNAGQLGNFEHPLARPAVGEVAGDDVRDRGHLAAAVGTPTAARESAERALDVRVAMATGAQRSTNTCWRCGVSSAKVKSPRSSTQ